MNQQLIEEERELEEKEKQKKKRKRWLLLLLLLLLILFAFWRCSVEEPYFYIGYPENNGYDIVLTFLTEDGEVLYQTKYIAPGTNVKIPGTDFAEKGLHEYLCNIAAYEQNTGKLVSDSVNVIMKIQYD